ncbi:PREDICTED: hamartin-like [Branchiostoma belcheri]|uniref:Hamartin-like n=1 Tax=Branchiostoma belcheri TaxID=7741 RepID=A0A6P4ZIE5_BRABE|nr:PREDICTED: hamartin-like [Branchiostoma belcheri]
MAEKQVDASELFSLLSSPDLHVVDEIKALIHENLNTAREPWLLNCLVEFYVATNNQPALEVLVGIREPHDKHLLTKLHEYVARGCQASRLAALTLLGHVVRKHPSWLYKITQHSIMATLLKLLKRETDIPNVMSGVLIITTLLPMVPTLIAPYLSSIFEVFSRLAAWNTNKPGPIPDVYLLHLHIAVYALFHRLYSMYPCNFLAYLRAYYSTRDHMEVFEDSIKPMLERVRMHPLLIISSSEEETKTNRWRKMETHDIVIECAKVCLDPLESGRDWVAAPLPPSGLISREPSQLNTSLNYSFSPMPSAEASLADESHKKEKAPSQKPSLVEDSPPFWSPSNICGLSTPPHSHGMSPASSHLELTSSSALHHSFALSSAANTPTPLATPSESPPTIGGGEVPGHGSTPKKTSRENLLSKPPMSPRSRTQIFQRFFSSPQGQTPELSFSNSTPVSPLSREDSGGTGVPDKSQSAPLTAEALSEQDAPSFPPKVPKSGLDLTESQQCAGTFHSQDREEEGKNSKDILTPENLSQVVEKLSEHGSSLEVVGPLSSTGLDVDKDLDDAANLEVSEITDQGRSSQGAARTPEDEFHNTTANLTGAARYPQGEGLVTPDQDSQPEVSDQFQTNQSDSNLLSYDTAKSAATFMARVKQIRGHVNSDTVVNPSELPRVRYKSYPPLTRGDKFVPSDSAIVSPNVPSAFKKPAKLSKLKIPPLDGSNGSLTDNSSTDISDDVVTDSVPEDVEKCEVVNYSEGKSCEQTELKVQEEVQQRLQDSIEGLEEKEKGFTPIQEEEARMDTSTPQKVRDSVTQTFMEPYEHLIPLALQFLPGMRPGECAILPDGEEKGSLPSQRDSVMSMFSKVSPLEVLDRHIELGGDVHSKELSRIPLVNMDSINWTHFGGAPPADEVTILKDQLLLLHNQLLFERHKRDLHAQRNRRLLGKTFKARAMEEQNVAMQDQLQLQEKEIVSQKGELRQLWVERKDLLERLERKDAELQLNTRQYQQEQDRLQAQVEDLRQSMAAKEEHMDRLKKDLKTSSARLFTMESELCDMADKVAHTEDLRQQVEALNRQLLLMGELQQKYDDRLDLMKFTNNKEANCSAQLAAAKAELAGLKETLHAERTEREMAKKRISELEESLGNREVVGLEQKRMLESVKSLSRGQLQAMEQKYNSLKRICQQMENQILKLYSKLEGKGHHRNREKLSSENISTGRGQMERQVSHDVASSTESSESQSSIDSVKRLQPPPDEPSGQRSSPNTTFGWEPGVDNPVRSRMKSAFDEDGLSLTSSERLQAEDIRGQEETDGKGKGRDVSRELAKHKGEWTEEGARGAQLEDGHRRTSTIGSRSTLSEDRSLASMADLDGSLYSETTSMSSSGARGFTDTYDSGYA